MHWMLMPLRRYADFSGRSRRMEFWMWQLGKFIFFMALFALGFAMVGPALLSRDPNNIGGAIAGIILLYLVWIIVGLAILVPDLAVAVRRLHDTERSGWWILAPLAPYIPMMVLLSVAGASFNPKDPTAGGSMAALGIVMGVCGLAVMVLAIILLVFYFLEGTPGPNKYGPDPKSNTGEVFS